MKYFELDKTISLESGQQLVKPTVAYHTYGKLNASKSNVVWVCHALTANSEVFEWWPGLFGENQLFNPDDHFIVCANIIGSHYGSTGPLSVNPETKSPYFHTFPEITIRDMVTMHLELAEHLAIEKISLLIGGSMGGHQALEWAIIEPERIQQLCLLATSAVISPWANAFNHTQRRAIEADPTWKISVPTAGEEGMKVARSIALLSYRNQGAYNETQSENLQKNIYPSKAASYQDYQGEKLSKRFNAFSYWHISKAMDSQNVARNRGTLETVLQKVKARTLILTIQNDLLFPESDQKTLALHIPNAIHNIVPSRFGHDGFLIETTKLSEELEAFLVPTTITALEE